MQQAAPAISVHYHTTNQLYYLSCTTLSLPLGTGPTVDVVVTLCNFVQLDPILDSRDRGLDRGRRKPAVQSRGIAMTREEGWRNGTKGDDCQSGPASQYQGTAGVGSRVATEVEQMAGTARTGRLGSAVGQAVCTSCRGQDGPTFGCLKIARVDRLGTTSQMGVRSDGEESLPYWATRKRVCALCLLDPGGGAMHPIPL